MTTYSSLIIGVFHHQSDAKQAIKDLRDAGFSQNQLGLAWREGSVTATDLFSDLVKLGVSQEHARYYDNEYQAGRPIVSVRADGREQEASGILRHYGAYNYDSGGESSDVTANVRQEADITATRDVERERRAEVTAPSGRMETGRGSKKLEEVEHEINAVVTNFKNKIEQAVGMRTARGVEHKRVETTGPSGRMGTTVGTRTAGDVEREINAVVTNFKNKIGPAAGTKAARDVEYGRGTTVTGPSAQIGREEERRMQLQREELQATKESVATGEARLRKDVISEEKTIEVPVTHEEVYVEVHPVAEGQVTQTPVGQEEVIRVPIHEEQVNVTKQTVVTGEVTISKRPVEEKQQFTETVRHEEAHLEREGNPPVHIEKDITAPQSEEPRSTTIDEQAQRRMRKDEQARRRTRGPNE